MIPQLSRPRFSILPAIAFVFAVLVASAAEGRTITLVWDASVDPTVTGYQVSYGMQPGVYTTTVDVGNRVSWQVDLPGSQYYFAVRAYDAAGNRSAYSLEVGDAVGVALTNPGDQSDASGTSISLPLATVGSPRTFSASGLPGGLSINSTTGLISGTITTASGTFLVTARVTDSGGNVASVQFYWTVTPNPGGPPPTVTSVTPSTISTAGNVSVTIRGTNFVGTPGVSIGGAAATGVVRVNSTTITAVAPAHAVGAVNVVVTNPDNRSATLANGVTYANVTSDSVAPQSGTGSSQAFSLKYSDTVGAADIASAWVWFSAPGGSMTNSCAAYYERSSNRVFLLNDVGSQWTSGVVGSASTLRNTQCSIALGSTTASNAGQVLTVNLPVTFATTYSGSKNVILFAGSMAGLTSGWQQRGTWTVPAGQQSVMTTSVTPSSGSGMSQSFTLQYSDSAGAADISSALAWFGPAGASAANTCAAYYERSVNTLFLLNDPGTQWMPGVLGSASTLRNSQCSIALATTTVSLAGQVLTVNLPVTFAAAFSGAKNVSLFAGSATGVTTGWELRGSWTVPGTQATVTADSVAPSSGSGASQSFALQYSDTAGALDLSTAWVWFNSTGSTSAVNSCLAFYDRANNALFLLNDLGTLWTSGVLGSGATLQNSQCRITLNSTATAVLSGPTLTLTLPVTFKTGFAGSKTVNLWAANAIGANSGWQARGLWTVP
jgi:hypothetical protein